MADKAHRVPDAAREVVMRRILVVDDDLHTRLAIGIWLKQCGFRVAITDGGESGLAALNEGTFDLMIHRHLPSNQKKPDSPATIAIEE